MGVEIDPLPFLIKACKMRKNILYIPAVNFGMCFTPAAKRILSGTGAKTIVEAVNVAIAAGFDLLPGINEGKAAMLLNSLNDALSIITKYNAEVWKADVVTLEPNDNLRLREIFEIDLLDLYTFLPVLNNIKETISLFSPQNEAKQVNYNFNLLATFLTGYITPGDQIN